MKISTEHRDALNEALDETAGYEGDVYVFDVKHIEILRSAVIAMLEDDEQTTTVAPAVDAQPVAIYQVQMADDSWMDVSHEDLLDLRPEETTRTVYASAQSWGLRKDAEELLRRIPTTPEQMIDFIGRHFDSMQADGWTDTLPSKPTGDLSMVRYSLTVHDLLSAFEWSDLGADAIRALSQKDPQ